MNCASFALQVAMQARYHTQKRPFCPQNSNSSQSLQKHVSDWLINRVAKLIDRRLVKLGSESKHLKLQNSLSADRRCPPLTPPALSGRRWRICLIHLTFQKPHCRDRRSSMRSSMRRRRGGGAEGGGGHSWLRGRALEHF